MLTRERQRVLSKVFEHLGAIYFSSAANTFFDQSFSLAPMRHIRKPKALRFTVVASA